MSFVRFLLLVSLLLPMARAVAAPPLDFEGFDDGQAMTNGYPGLVFSNTIILSAGLSLNELEFPPHAGTNVASDDAGAMLITFLSPIQSFSAYFTYALPLEMVAYDSSDLAVAQAVSAFGNNLAVSGDPGSTSNERLAVSHLLGFSSVRITGAADGASFAMDDVTIAAVPEPGMWLLLSAGVFVLGGAVRRRRRRH